MDNQHTIVLGLGNELISDDGVGIHVVQELRHRLQADGYTNRVVCEELAVGGLALLDHIVGYERCVIIDAVVTGSHPAGTIYRFYPTPAHSPRQAMTSHQTDLPQILRLAHILHAKVPESITVYGVEASDVTMFNDRCTELVQKAIPQLVDIIYRDLFDGSSHVPASDNEATEWEIITAVSMEQL